MPSSSAQNESDDFCPQVYEPGADMGTDACDMDVSENFSDLFLRNVMFIRARAPPVGGPIVFQRICISLLGLFQGLDMLKLLSKFAGNSKPQKVIVFWSNLKWEM